MPRAARQHAFAETLKAGGHLTVADLVGSTEDFGRIWRRHVHTGEVHMVLADRDPEGTPRIFYNDPITPGDIVVSWHLQGNFTMCLLQRKGRGGKARRSFLGVAKRMATEGSDLHRGMEISFSRAAQDLYERW